MSKVIASITEQMSKSFSRMVDEFIESEMSRLELTDKDLKNYKLDITDHNFLMSLGATHIKATYTLKLVKKDE